MKVIVLSTLGGLIKKITEMEITGAQSSRDTAISRLSYYKILEQWPISDKAKLEMLKRSFQVHSVQLVAIHEAISASLNSKQSNGSVFEHNVRKYFSIKDQLKKLMKEIDRLSLPSGKPPFSFEIGEGNEPTANVTSAAV